MTLLKTIFLLSLTCSAALAFARGDRPGPTPWDLGHIRGKLTEQAGRVGDCTGVHLVEPAEGMPLLGIAGLNYAGQPFIKTTVHRCGRRDCYALRFVRNGAVVNAFTVYETSSGVLTGLERPNLLYRLILDDADAIDGVMDDRGRTLCGPKLH